MTFSEILVQVFICVFLLVQMRAVVQKSVYIQAQHQNIFFYLPTSTHSFSNEMLNSVDFIGKLKEIKVFHWFKCFFLVFLSSCQTLAINDSLFAIKPAEEEEICLKGLSLKVVYDLDDRQY